MLNSVLETQNSNQMENQYQHINVMLEKEIHERGFGIAITGGRDSGSQSGDSSIVISDVIAGSPADSLVNIGDILIAINGENVENVDHEYAVELLRSMKKCVYLLLKRKIGNRKNININISPKNEMKNRFSNSAMNYSDTKNKNSFYLQENNSCEMPSNYSEFTCELEKGKRGFGLYLGNLVFIKDKVKGTSAYESDLQEGDIITTINDVPVDSCKSTDEVLGLIKKSCQRIKVGIIRPNNDWLPTPLTQKSSFVTKADKNLETQYRKPIKSQRQRINLTEERETTCQKDNEIRSMSHERNNPRTQSFNQKRIDSKMAGPSTKSEYDVRYENLIPQKINQVEAIKEKKLSKRGEIKNIQIMDRGKHLGLQLIGGNKYGIFVSSVIENSPASLAGIRVGDQLLSVNGVEFIEITREDAVMYLLSLKNEILDITCTSKKPTFEKIKYQQCDQFYIRVNFDYLKPTSSKELVLRRGELLMVRDTMVGGIIGSWAAVRISVNEQTGECGIIPNKTRAEQLAVKSKLEERKNQDMKRRMRPGKYGSNRTKAEYQSQDRLDCGSFNDESVPIPAYQIVVKNSASFKRPVIILGLASDVYRDFLRRRLPREFDMPRFNDSHLSDNTKDFKKSAIKMYQIQNIIDEGKHCLLDVSFNGIEILHQANLPPIIIYIKIAEKKLASQFRVAAVNMVYGKNRDPKSKKEVRYINRYGMKFNNKYPIYITSVLEVFDQTVDQVYLEILNIIRSRQNDEIFLSAENNITEQYDSIVLQEPVYQSGYNSTTDSATDDDADSLYSSQRDDEKVFKSNRFESSNSEYSYRYQRQHESTDTDNGRVINIQFEGPTRSKNTNRQMEIMESRDKNQKISHRKTKSRDEIVELTLNAVLKAPSDGKGGLTDSPSTKVSVYVPPGAIQALTNKEIFFKIYTPKQARSKNFIVSTNENDIVLVCGPEGFEFLRPIEIRMPYVEKNDEGVESQIYITPDIGLDSSHWKKITLNFPGAHGNTFNLTNNMIAILVDRF